MKHIKAVSWLAAAFLVFALALSVAAPSGKAVPPPSPTPAAASPATPEHPEIHEAIAALRRAKEHMEHAAHDFGGHKVEALRATDEAIHQLEVCLKYDK
ncbi:MAG TPA: hypothetical protein VEG63_01640 [Candidatus Acidoferrales bacterium]|nr:hypothetical protein [Candidatus Acidoferrales bacterium]